MGFREVLLFIRQHTYVCNRNGLVLKIVIDWKLCMNYLHTNLVYVFVKLSEFSLIYIPPHVCDLSVEINFILKRCSIRTNNLKIYVRKTAWKHWYLIWGIQYVQGPTIYTGKEVLYVFFIFSLKKINGLLTTLSLIGPASWFTAGLVNKRCSTSKSGLLHLHVEITIFDQTYFSTIHVHECNFLQIPRTFRKSFSRWGRTKLMKN